ncbi:hypothetical protein EYF80_027113 [Liparis tanakae]|uniref:Uncharacterized protein n=1 Tax=Liparis tanakae TaxID=230148 RepID=A0A4Z2HD15_9TELE|nr:hypothetical protein EYF80_027113 [Liparis tanakae]
MADHLSLEEDLAVREKPKDGKERRGRSLGSLNNCKADRYFKRIGATGESYFQKDTSRAGVRIVASDVAQFPASPS